MRSISVLELPIQLDQTAITALKLRHIILQRSSPAYTWQGIEGARFDSVFASTTFRPHSITLGCVRLLVVYGLTEGRLTLALRFLHGPQATRAILPRLGLTTPDAPAVLGTSLGDLRMFLRAA
jgi:hypothetical protein